MASLALFVSAACSKEPAAPRPNILLITIDTLRADRLGAKMPHLDALEADSVVFDQGRSTTSWTLPALSSLMTSTYCSTHGAIKMASVLSSSFTTLGERFRDAGYDTAGVASHVFLKDRYGLSQGFADYDTSLAKSMTRSHEVTSSPQITKRVLDWFDRRDPSDERPFLMWAHYFDPHAEYLIHKEYSKGYSMKTEPDRYRGELRFTDAWLGRLLAGLEERGLSEDTIIVLVADHGEEFSEHGSTRHGHALYDELVRVPFVIHVPNGRGPYAGRIEPARIESPVSLIDVLPTLLELADVATDETQMAGRSLVPMMLGEPGPARPLMSEVALRDGRHMDTIVFGGWKLIEHLDGKWEDELELYDLRSDPGETVNLARSEAGRAAELVELLAKMKRDATARGEGFGKLESLELNAAELKRLADLGYTESDPDAPASPDADPSE